MNTQVRDRWVSALRSGKYKKAKYGLQDLDNCFDATGVLCELAIEDNVIPVPIRQDDKNKHIFFGYVYNSHEGKDRQVTGLPRAVQEWSGVDYRTGMKVAMMGDNGKSFNDIADYIENNL